MLTKQIEKDLEEATRKQDPLVLKTLRFILSEIRYAQIDKQKELTDEEVVTLLQKEVKKRNEAIVLMKKGGRQDLVDEEETKLLVIKKYLPQELTDEELEKIVTDAVSRMKGANFGAVIQAVMAQTKGRADGRKVADLVKKKTQSP